MEFQSVEMLARMKAAAIVAIAVTLIVAPLAYAISPQEEDLLMATGVAIALGVGISLRVERKTRIVLGLSIGAIVGVATAILAGNIAGRGVGVLVPPIVGFSVGFVDGIGAARLRGFRSSVLAGMTIGSIIGLGMATALGWGGLLGGFISGVIVGTVTGMRRDPERGWRAGIVRPPAALMVTCIVFITFVCWLAWEELARVEMVLVAIGLILFVPIICFQVGHALAIWLRPRATMYAELTDYLRVMWVPIGGFALGLLAIIIVFAGLYGSLHRLTDGQAFASTDQVRHSILDWLYFSFFMATGQNDPVWRPVSALARMLVTIETIAALGWMVVVFAAVMSHLQPRLDEIRTRPDET